MRGGLFAYVAGGVRKRRLFKPYNGIGRLFCPIRDACRAFQARRIMDAAGANAIATNGAVKKARELNKKELGGMQQRRINKYAKDLDPSHPDYARVY
jgi:hypothetical protein